MNNKKGISAIVATVLIILITVAAVTIIWAAIIPMINNQLSRGTVCLDAVSQVSLSDQGYTCADSANTNVSLQIRHGAKDFELSDIQVLVSDSGGNTHSYLLSGPATTSFPGSLGQSLGTVLFPGVNEEKVYVIDTFGDIPAGTKIVSVDIAPVVKVGNSKETCEISASRTLKVC